MDPVTMVLLFCDDAVGNAEPWKGTVCASTVFVGREAFAFSWLQLAIKSLPE